MCELIVSWHTTERSPRLSRLVLLCSRVCPLYNAVSPVQRPSRSLALSPFSQTAKLKSAGFEKNLSAASTHFGSELQSRESLSGTEGHAHHSGEVSRQAELVLLGAVL